MLTSSMLMFDFSMNPLTLFAVIAVSISIGYAFRRSQIANMHDKLMKAKS